MPNFNQFGPVTLKRGFSIFMNEEEIWLPVTGYEGRYEVSNMGRVKSLSRTYVFGKGAIKHTSDYIMKQCKSKDGYFHLRLCIYGVATNKLINILVADAFIPNPDNLPEVHHVDFDTTNNKAANLKRVTGEENKRYSFEADRLKNNRNSRSVGQYDKMGGLIKVWPSTREAHRYGFYHSAIVSVAAGRRKTHKGFTWKYL